MADDARAAQPGLSRFTDGAGVVGAILAALCCAGTPIVVSVITAVGLGFLRNDAILWPLMLGALGIALWGFWRGRRLHQANGPLATALVGAVVMAAGVIVVHGPIARPMIYSGAVMLLAATVWNARLRQACAGASPAARVA